MTPETKNSEGSEREPTYYIGIGASAGGLEAIETFFSHMDPDSGFAFIVIQHLSPDYKSMMKELLSKKTRMAVHRVEDGMQVAPNSLYLIPPKKNLSIFHGKLMLSEQDHSRGINLPIDVFLRSLAEDQGEKAIGIILSGTGSDGMRGVRSIKEAGGMVMVQNESTAKFDGMPRSAISTGLADFILAPEEMPEQIRAFVKHPYVAKTGRSEALSDDENGLTRIFAILRERCKIDFTYYKPSTVHRRIERRMTVNQIQDIRDYVGYLQSYPGEVMTLYRELLIGVTNFFRDPEVWKELSRQWMPDLLKRASGREVRFWLAGCSTGEEAYTLAILARECMADLGISRDIKIFATDIDRDAILRAGGGVYPESIAADLSVELLSKYFYRKEENFQIARNIREMVVFAQHNIIKDPPFTNIDLVSCRNLLIYLQPILQKRVLEMFGFSLNANGILVLGTSETTGDYMDRFDVLHQKHKIYQARGDRRPPVSNAVLSNNRRAIRHPLELRRYGAERRSFSAAESDRLLERLMVVLTEELVPLAIVVNERMEVLHILGDTEGFFKLPSGKVQNDISKMAAKDLAIPLATGIQRVFRSRDDLTYTNIRLQHRDQTKLLRMRIKPLPERKGEEPLVAVFLGDVDVEPAGAVGEKTASYDFSEEAEQRIRDLEQDLQFTRENLQATIEELETANEELQATNEELLASNEELQSTNEELQSTNEELHTVNSEYQNKIIELTELNNDVENLLTSTRIAQLLLDENLEIRKYSPEISKIFKIWETDIGRPITHLSHRLVKVDPVELVRKVLDRTDPVEQEVSTDDGCWYLMRVLPYQIGPNTYSGAVMTFVDITHTQENKRALAENESELRETARLARVGSWSYDPVAAEHRWSDETFRIHDLEPGEVPRPEEGIRYYAPEHRETITHAFTKAVEDGIAYDLTLQIVTAAGRRRWVRTLGRPEMNNGRVERIKGVFQDITELKQAEIKLEESRQACEDMIRFMPSGMFLYELDSDDRLVLIHGNQEAERITGLSIEDWRGKSFDEIWPEASESGLSGRLLNVIQTGETFYAENLQYRDQKVSGVYRIVAFRLTGQRLAVSFEDITERPRADSLGVNKTDAAAAEIGFGNRHEE